MVSALHMGNHHGSISGLSLEHQVTHFIVAHAFFLTSPSLEFRYPPLWVTTTSVMLLQKLIRVTSLPMIHSGTGRGVERPMVAVSSIIHRGSASNFLSQLLRISSCEFVAVGTLSMKTRLLRWSNSMFAETNI